MIRRPRARVRLPVAFGAPAGEGGLPRAATRGRGPSTARALAPVSASAPSTRAAPRAAWVGAGGARCPALPPRAVGCVFFSLLLSPPFQEAARIRPGSSFIAALPGRRLSSWAVPNGTRRRGQLRASDRRRRPAAGGAGRRARSRRGRAPPRPQRRRRRGRRRRRRGRAGRAAAAWRRPGGGGGRR